MAQATVEIPSMERQDAERRQERRLKMSYEEFLAWSDEDTHAEWVALSEENKGEVIVFMPPKTLHQRVIGFLHSLLDLFVNLFDLGVVVVAPLEMQVARQGSSREPDILFVAQENLARLTEERLAGPADLIIEVVSDDSVHRDRHDKYREYRDAGVREYWVVDPRPDKRRADFFRLDAGGDYELYATEEDEKVASAVLTGFWLRPAWLWQADTLNPLTCCLEIDGVAEALTQHIADVRRT
jgi:Uma2 family endonuclease